MLSSVQCRQVCVIRDITLAKSERIAAGVCVCLCVTGSSHITSLTCSLASCTTWGSKLHYGPGQRVQISFM